MKKLLTTFLLFMFLVPVIQAQPGKPDGSKKREEIEAMKIGFLTRKLSLTPAEAQAFWPVYNTYNSELRKARDTHHAERKSLKKKDEELTDADAEKLIDNEIKFRQQELDIMKKYHNEFKSVLPVKKVAILYRSEDDFKRELLERIREKRGPDRD